MAERLSSIYLYCFDGTNLCTFRELAEARSTVGGRAVPDVWYFRHLEFVRAVPYKYNRLRSTGVGLPGARELAELVLAELVFVPELEAGPNRGGAGCGVSIYKEGKRCDYVCVWAVGAWGYVTARVGNIIPEPLEEDVDFYLSLVCSRGDISKVRGRNQVVGGAKLVDKDYRGFNPETRPRCMTAVVPGRLHSRGTGGCLTLELYSALKRVMGEGYEDYYYDSLRSRIVAQPLNAR